MPAPAYAPPERYVARTLARAGSSFRFAFRFLPPRRRAAISAFYAFCREVDDAVDDAASTAQAESALAWWREELPRAFAGAPTHPAMQALLPHATDFGIREEQLRAIVEGCAMDIDHARYPDYASLQRYCHLVAGIVGEVAAGIFGQTHPQTTEYAHALGQALQLTNIVRDVGEDARRGRIYLPLDELERFGVATADIVDQRDTPAFAALMRFQAQRAHGWFDRALGLLPDCDRRAQQPGLMMAHLYRALLRAIEREGFPVLHRRTRLHPLHKLWVAGTVLAGGK
ncbi:presqualene diphosphate synthase HpnD [Candidatus Symbiobacter mobilis]|uniref:Phytoene synthase n=1 Tax=Candidatus Symbiobacter mobilis CR TaxID=946483 RepID=U5NBD9_9BURK|nr:presqualene diphosphate synthase HpnD [Candidatus Symbiobacter mobilis]AGX87489.1 phytoene synthase [Candidatus Symbiobacter mobilis CR]